MPRSRWVLATRSRIGRGDVSVGNPDGARIYVFLIFELILLFYLDKLFPVEQFEAAVSQSTVPLPLLPLSGGRSQDRVRPNNDNNNNNNNTNMNINNDNANMNLKEVIWNDMLGQLEDEIYEDPPWTQMLPKAIRQLQLKSNKYT